jgi:hypothetical protein
MADEQRPGDLKMRSQHVDKVNVDGQILSADEILARAQQRIQKKQQPVDQQTLKKRLLTPDEIAAIKAKNNQSRQQIIKKKPSLVQNQKSDPFFEKVPTLDTKTKRKR